jgi:putative RNA 2'-phosphotransferase
MNPPLTRASKFLSYVLRHRPDAIGLSLDAQGWAVIDDLVRLSQASQQPLSRAMIVAVVRTNDKQRFRLSDDGSRMRASQGHSLGVALALTPQEPPTILFHGTATRFLEAILKEGIKAGSRRQVHLSATYDTAITVGQRHGTPVVLAVQARAMYHTGLTFSRADNSVWLTDHVPVAFIRRLSGPPDGAASPVVAAESPRSPRHASS